MGNGVQLRFIAQRGFPTKPIASTVQAVATFTTLITSFLYSVEFNERFSILP